MIVIKIEYNDRVTLLHCVYDWRLITLISLTSLNFVIYFQFVWEALSPLCAQKGYYSFFNKNSFLSSNNTNVINNAFC